MTTHPPSPIPHRPIPRSQSDVRFSSLDSSPHSTSTTNHYQNFNLDTWLQVHWHRFGHICYVLLFWLSNTDCGSVPKQARLTNKIIYMCYTAWMQEHHWSYINPTNQTWWLYGTYENVCEIYHICLDPVTYYPNHIVHYWHVATPHPQPSWSWQKKCATC